MYSNWNSENPVEGISYGELIFNKMFLSRKVAIITQHDCLFYPVQYDS